jgi:hypothetical protein
LHCATDFNCKLPSQIRQTGTYKQQSMCWSGARNQSPLLLQNKLHKKIVFLLVPKLFADPAAISG